jgi:hypothetical protein
MTTRRAGFRAGSGGRSADRERLRLLATLAELQAEIARRPVALHQVKLTALRAQIDALAQTQAKLREGVDAVASGEMAIGTAAYLTARAEDLRKAQAAGYRSLAQAEAEMAALKDTAARARARADVLDRLNQNAGRR